MFLVLVMWCSRTYGIRFKSLLPMEFINYMQVQHHNCLVGPIDALILVSLVTESCAISHAATYGSRDDKIAGVVLADSDPNPINAAVSHHALICEKCFGHNGLVKESGWVDAR
ncbi:hypothetical protein BJ138DRAFT_82495 [Hygrophoropsis aurantiaca]|uniref:Uncharacterized protein n=1 Tax=Hygrophoropsis aurantiaca TaxID=72124 RepID=A0ACB7ZRR6_9AGAM|nr:hypothetical protein BJ138DRAFT_82495 [Hygrophoropsis aurantiaca]